MNDLKWTDSGGIVWHKYSCAFTSPDGTYEFDLWAISDEHADLQMQALKETAAVIGKVES